MRLVCVSILGLVLGGEAKADKCPGRIALVSTDSPSQELVVEKIYYRRLEGDAPGQQFAYEGTLSGKRYTVLTEVRRGIGATNSSFEGTVRAAKLRIPEASRLMWPGPGGVVTVSNGVLTGKFEFVCK